jgi:hypothetical protein
LKRTVSERSLANLKPITGADDPRRYKGGPGPGLVSRIRHCLKTEVMVDGKTGDSITRADIIAETLVTLAEDGELEAIKVILAYTEGKPTQSLDVSGEVEHRVTIDSIRKAIGIVS